MLQIAWTTTETRTQAESLARQTVELGLAVCAQIDSPITSVYRWEGKVCTSEEHRVWFKCIEANAAALEAWIHAHHPYHTPQWIAVSATRVGEKYLSWAGTSLQAQPFHS